MYGLQYIYPELPSSKAINPARACTELQALRQLCQRRLQELADLGCVDPGHIQQSWGVSLKISIYLRYEVVKLHGVSLRLYNQDSKLSI